MTELVERSGAKARLNLHSGQQKAWKSQARFVFMLAGTQGGKTSFAPWWQWREIERWNGGDHIAATASYDLFKLKFLPEIRNVYEHILGIGRYWAGDRVMELKDPMTGKFLANRSDDPMWGRIILRSAESKGGLESLTARSALLDECGMDSFTIGVWEAVLRRLSLSQGRVLGSTTLYNLGWMKRAIYDKWQKGDPDIDVIQFDSTENPQFPEEEYERARQTMPTWKFNMFYRGLYDKPAGLIYSDFDESRHVLEPFAIPAEWRRYGGQDYGGVNTAGLCIAHDPVADRYIVTKEYLEGGKTAAGHAETFKQWGVSRWYGGAKSEGQWRDEFKAAGIPVSEPPISEVEVGIDRVIALIKQDRLYILNSCTRLLDEINTYSRELDDDGEPTEKIKDKNKFHLNDGLRYVVVGITDRPTPAGVVAVGRSKGWT